MEKEVRSLEIRQIQEDSRTVEGYAVVTNSESRDLGGFVEVIAPEALEGDIIQRSDVLALLDHNQSRGVLARSKYGKGSLTLEVDDKGLLYRFEAPKTPLGDELVEALKRGDISTSSFAFTVKTDEWTKREDGTYLRTIKEFGELYDISPVFREAYEETSVALRSLEEFKNNEVPADVKEQEETPAEQEQEQEQKQEEQTEVDALNQTEEKEAEQAENSESRNNINIITDNKNSIKMEKFSLIKSINDVVNNRSFDEVAQTVMAEGIAEMRKSGLSYSGQIQIPVMECREEPTTTPATAVQATVATAGEEAVAIEKLNILEPLRANSVLSAAGVTFLTGLVGNLSIPSYDGSTVAWAGEIAPAANGQGSFDEVEFSPQRLTAYLDISKQFLNQDSVGAEELLKMDIVNALKDKLEATILGDEAGSNTKPAGIFANAGAKDLTYTGLVGLEQALEEGNVTGNFKFIVSPAIKATLKTTTVSGQKSDLRMIMEDGEVNGYDVISTSNAKGIAFGNFADYVVAQWGSIDLTVDPYTQAARGCVRLVINAYFDAKPRRSGTIVAKK